MRIGINALYLLPGKVGGSETYLRSLVKCLFTIDRDNTYVLFINQESIGIFPETDPRIKIVLCPIHASNRPNRILWEQCILPFQIRRLKLDVLFSPGETAPFFCPATSMLVIYDLQYINQPHNFSRFQLFFLKTIIYGSIKTADEIITISNHAKNDIVKHYKIEPENITVGYLGVNHAVFSPGSSQDTAAVRNKYNLPEHYLLYTASLLPHKNHERLLKAFREIKGTMPGRKLVLTGAWETGYDRTFALISALGLQQDVIMLGWLPFEDIALIYRGAELFVYPSLHEGFGLPLLEAMASGVPVVCSDLEPLTEIAGDAAMRVNPYDPLDIARGILSIWRDNTLRLKLVKAGLEKARIFTWERTATTTLKFLNSRNPYKNI